MVDVSVWLRDPRDFHEMNAAYAEFFRENCPARSIFRIDFMFDCRVEIKVTAYRPRTESDIHRPSACLQTVARASLKWCVIHLAVPFAQTNLLAHRIFAPYERGVAEWPPVLTQAAP